MGKTIAKIYVDATKVLQSLDKYGKDMPVKINNAIHEGGLLLQGEIQESIAGRKGEPRSVDTGRFMGTITTDNSMPLQSTIYSPQEYSIYLEEGTSRIPPRHHFRNSLIRKKPEIKEKIDKAIKY